MNPINRWRILIIIFTFSFLGVMGFVFLSTTTLSSQARADAVSFKDQNNVPVTGPVRVLCFANADATAPHADMIVSVIEHITNSIQST